MGNELMVEWNIIKSPAEESQNDVGEIVNKMKGKYQE